MSLVLQLYLLGDKSIHKFNKNCVYVSFYPINLTNFTYCVSFLYTVDYNETFRFELSKKFIVISIG